jgi:hypothetical protein
MVPSSLPATVQPGVVCRACRLTVFSLMFSKMSISPH